MGDTFIVSGLVRKRAHLAGEIEAVRQRLGRLREDLKTIDGMIRLIGTSGDPSLIRRIRPYQILGEFRYGEQTRLCLSILRTSAEPMSARQIAERITEQKGFPLETWFVVRVRSTVMRLTREGQLRKVGKRRSMKWTLPD